MKVGPSWRCCIPGRRKEVCQVCTSGTSVYYTASRQRDLRRHRALYPIFSREHSCQLSRFCRDYPDFFSLSRFPVFLAFPGFFSLSRIPGLQ